MTDCVITVTQVRGLVQFRFKWGGGRAIISKGSGSWTLSSSSSSSSNGLVIFLSSSGKLHLKVVKGYLTLSATNDYLVSRTCWEGGMPATKAFSETI